MRSFLMRSLKLLLPLLASTLCFAQQADRIPGPIDSSQMVALPGHGDRFAKPQYDQGPVEPSFQFGRVTLVMAPSPSQQVALNLLLAQQQDGSSPNYHKWLTPEQFAERFGVSQGDINKVKAWLEAQGFQVFGVPRGRISVGFSGTAAQIQSAFKTEIHRYNVNGREHIANSTPVEVPAALSGVVTGVRGLTDFHPKPMYVRPVHSGKTGPHPSFATPDEGTGDVLAPGDIATIYDLNPFYTASPAIDGTGQKLAIIGETDVYLADIADFRSDFGLNAITGCSTDANGIVTATACNTPNFQYLLVPGVADLGAPSTCGDLPEADLDIEWSGATARNAQIIFVNAPATFNAPTCTEITNNGGTDVSLAYAIDNVVAPVISMSYDLCEAEATSLETELQQGNTEGITIMNSSGDVGAAACNDGPPSDTRPYPAADGGLAVNYPASSPEVTGVGGTSIPYPTFYNSSYWSSNSTSTVNFGGSAQTNLEGNEAAWNDTAAFAQLCLDGDLTSQFCSQGGSPAVSGWKDITSAATAQEDLWVSAGGGGMSNCVGETGEGICQTGFAKPSWQSAITIPTLTTTYRLVPDVSLLASPEFPGYIFCTPLDQWTSSSSTASTCAGGISSAVDNYESLVGGTSASSPVFAGIVILLNQYLGSAGLGNINPMLYSLAATPANGAFHHITSGDNDVYCQAGTPSGQPADVICPAGGVFGFDSSNSDSTTGYNLVGGLGSVDGNSLAIAWAAARTTGSSVTITSVSATNVTVGTSVSFSVSVTPASGVGSVRFSTLNGGTTTVLGSATLNVPYPSTSTGTTTFATTKLPGGSNSVTATYTGDASVNASTSAPTTVTVTVPFTMSASTLTPASVPAGQASISTLAITPTSGFTGTVSFTNSTASNPGSCTAGLPAGALCSFSPGSVSLDGNPAHTMNVALSITTVANMALPSGAQAITVTGTSGSTSITAGVNLTVTATNQSFALTTTAATFPVTVGGTEPVSLTVTGTGTPISFVTNSTTALPLTYTCSGQSSTGTSLALALISCQWSPSNGQSVTAAGVTLNLVTTAPTSGQLRPPLERGRRIFYAMLLPGLFGIMFAAGSRTRGARLLGLIVVLGVSTVWLGSCGGSGGGGTTTPPNPGTPAGTYTVTINATTGGANPVPLTNNGSPLTITLNVSQ